MVGKASFGPTLWNAMGRVCIRIQNTAHSGNLYITELKTDAIDAIPSDSLLVFVIRFDICFDEFCIMLGIMLDFLVNVGKIIDFDQAQDQWA